MTRSTRPATPDRSARLLRRAALTVVVAASAAAAAETGGFGGPLGALCLLPLAVAFWTASPVAEGLALSFVAAAGVLVARVAGFGAGPPAGWTGEGLGLVATAAVLGLLAGGMARANGVSAAARAASERARAQRAAVRFLLVEQPGLLVAADPDGRIRAAYGEPPAGVSAEVLFQNGIAAASPADAAVLREALRAASENGSAELLFGCPSMRLSVRRAPDGRLIGRLTDARAERARTMALEAERDRALDASAAKSRFLADMSHELRTPLNAVLGFSDVMRTRLYGPLPGRYAEYAEMIHESGRHLLDLINDLLDMSKIEAAKYQLKVEKGDAREPVSAALRLLRVQADEAGISLRGVLPPHPVPAEFDKRALKQIALNLTGNALKFTPRGGRVTVSLGVSGGRLELRVADTGVGIPAEDLARLGRPYEQAGDAASRAKGTGLGLSLVRALANLHGGTMTAESAVGEGTTVTVRLPVLLHRESAEPALAPFTAGR